VKPAHTDPASVPIATGRRAASLLSDYIALTKPRLNGLVVATSAAGYYLGSADAPALAPMVQTVVGTALVASGSAALNQVLERHTDALMRRTRLRPLPDGRVSAFDAVVFGLALSALGIITLALAANLLSAALALITLIVYVVVYTPMKKRSDLATIVGAIPGGLPPLIGWAAGHGSLAIGGWALFAIVFLWQIPHFMAIAWLYREDYGRAGFPMLPVIDPAGRLAGRQALLYACALLPVSLMPPVLSMTSTTYFWLVLALGAAMIALAWRFSAQPTESTARGLFFGSIIYLPLVWAAMIVTH
jgi:protoheme IX farnesyltransferase